jgi:hypothetical protein
MKNKVLLVSLILFSTSINLSQAQLFKKLKQKLEDKVDRQMDGMLNGRSENKTSGSSKSSAKLPYLEEVYTFVPGNTVSFSDNFASDKLGRMPKHWKTSGGGSVSTVPDVAGKWLALSPYTSYRIDSIMAMPGNFTVEFDLLTRSVEADDISELYFGFSRNNSNRDYISGAYSSGAITSTMLHFSNEEITNSSSDTEISNTLKFPLDNYANGLLHVAITVEGEDMRVYINKAKLLDTRMFKRNTLKYFYLTAPFAYKAEAMVFFSNFVIAKLN